MYVFQYGFPSSSKDLCDTRRRLGQGRWENGACVLSRETTWHLFQVIKGESVPSLFLQVLHIAISEGGFLQLFVCWSFVSACRIQWGRPCAARGGEEAQPWHWERSGVSERLVQLLWSTLSSEGWKMFFYVVAGDSIMSVTTAASSNTGETILLKRLICRSDWNSGFFSPRSFSRGSKWEEKVVTAVEI